MLLNLFGVPYRNSDIHSPDNSVEQRSLRTPPTPSSLLPPDVKAQVSELCERLTSGPCQLGKRKPDLFDATPERPLKTFRTRSPPSPILRDSLSESEFSSCSSTPDCSVDLDSDPFFDGTPSSSTTDSKGKGKEVVVTNEQASVAGPSSRISVSDRLLLEILARGDGVGVVDMISLAISTCPTCEYSFAGSAFDVHATHCRTRTFN